MRVLHRTRTCIIVIGAMVLLAVPFAALKASGGQIGAVLAQSGEDLVADRAMLLEALVSLPLATALGAGLAFRPRRAGTPPRSAPVIQTQIILALIGALVMLVVGASLARAFGVVGVAGLIRYRAKIDDPKDAGVMLAALAVGLASGVGARLLAIFAAAFIVGVLWVVESFEPQAHKIFSLKVTAKDPAALKGDLEQMLRRQHATFELRTSSNEEICYEVLLPMEKRTGALSNAIQALGQGVAVEWAEKNAKAKA
jgi:hypothetical protein